MSVVPRKSGQTRWAIPEQHSAFAYDATAAGGIPGLHLVPAPKPAGKPTIAFVSRQHDTAVRPLQFPVLQVDCALPMTPPTL